MATKQLSYADLVTGANAETLRAALEARIKIDEMLILREEAYQKIATLEAQVNDIVGTEVFEFDEPAVDIAWGGRSPKKKAVAKKPAPAKKELVVEEKTEVPTTNKESVESDKSTEELSYVDEDKEQD